MKKTLFLLCSAFSLCANNINAITRESASGTRASFVQIFDITKQINNKKLDNINPKIAITNSSGVMLTSVMNDINAIGYVSYGSLNNKIKALNIDNITINYENIKNKNYQISRNFNLIYKEENALIKDFLAFLNSNYACKIINDLKYICLNEKDYTSMNIKGKLTISGSSSISPLMQVLIKEYEKINPNANIDLLSTDSTMGYVSLINNISDIAMLSRELKTSEKINNIKSFVLAKDAIAIIVNINNKLNNISKDDVKKIYEGKITKWQEIK